MNAPVYVCVSTVGHLPHLKVTSATEVAVTLLYESRARGEMRIHAFAALPQAIHLVITPQGISARALMANWMAETEPLLKALIAVAGPVWDHQIVEQRLISAQAVQRSIQEVEQKPVRASLTSRPDTYRFCSAHARFRADIDPVALPAPSDKDTVELPTVSSPGEDDPSEPKRAEAGLSTDQPSAEQPTTEQAAAEQPAADQPAQTGPAEPSEDSAPA